MRLDDVEYQLHILSNLQTTGMEKSCTTGIPVSYSTYRNYKKANPDFAEKVKIALEMFASLTANYEAKKSLTRWLINEAEHGFVSKVTKRGGNDEIEYTLTKEEPPREWIVKRFIPEPSMLEKALIFVLGAIFRYLSKQEMPANER